MEAKAPVKPKPWRVKYIINPKFQFFMICFALLQSFVAIGILFALNAHFFERFKSMGIHAGIPPNHIYFQFLYEQQVYFTNAVLVVSGLIGVFIMLSMTLISHRIAGPLYRLSRHMQEIAEGKKISEIRFRQKDFFAEIAEIFNLMVLKINEDEAKKSNEDRQHEEKKNHDAA